MHRIAEIPDYKAYVEKQIELNRHITDLGFRTIAIEPGSYKGKLAIEQKHLQHTGFLHGGVISSLCDVCCGFAAFSVINKEQVVLTVELKVSYLNPGIGSHVLGNGWVLKKGGSLIFCESEIIAVQNEQETLIAKATATMAMVERSKL